MQPQPVVTYVYSSPASVGGQPLSSMAQPAVQEQPMFNPTMNNYTSGPYTTTSSYPNPSMLPPGTIPQPPFNTFASNPAMNMQSTPMQSQSSREGIFGRYFGGGSNKETRAEQKNLKSAERMFAKARKQYDKGSTKSALKYENKANKFKTNAKTAAETRQKDFEAARRIDGELQRLSNPTGPIYVDPAEEQKKKDTGKGEKGGRRNAKAGEADKKAGEADKKAGEAEKKTGDVQKGDADKKAGESEKNAGEAEKAAAEGKPSQSFEKADKADQKADEVNCNPSASSRATENSNEARQRAQNASEQAWMKDNASPTSQRRSPLLVGHEAPGQPDKPLADGMFNHTNPYPSCIFTRL